MNVLQDTTYKLNTVYILQGRIQDFKLGGVHLKKLRRAEGGAKNVGVFRVKNHDFTTKLYLVVHSLMNIAILKKISS
jgi:hypothetical protein